MLKATLGSGLSHPRVWIQPTLITHLKGIATIHPKELLAPYLVG